MGRIYVYAMFVFLCVIKVVGRRGEQLRCGNNYYPPHKYNSFLFCDRSLKAGIRNDELDRVSQAMWAADEADRINDVQLNVQTHVTDGTRTDNAPDPLFSVIPVEFVTNPIYAKQIAFFNDYIPDVSVAENLTLTDWKAIDDFLNLVTDSQVMKLCHQFLAEKGLVPENYNEFRENLYEIWYRLYDRGGKLSSCGGEHVQVGETDKSDISGLHNWVRFALLEQQGQVNYLGYVRIADLKGAYIIRNPFYWGDHYKPIGGFFIGTSPAFEMSLYTLCFYSKPDGICKVKLNGKRVRIQTHTMQFQDRVLIGTAYPDF